MSFVTAEINTTRPAGRRILREISDNPTIGKFEIPNIPRDETGKPIGISVDEYCDKLLAKIREHYEK